MNIQKSIVRRLQESKHLPDGMSMEDVRLSETIVVDGQWYWKSKGTCWTQPTDKSSPRKEIPEKEYREICAQAKNGVSEIPQKEDNLKGKELVSNGTPIGTFLSDDTIKVPAMTTSDGQEFAYKIESEKDMKWIMDKAKAGNLDPRDIKSVGERIPLEDDKKKEETPKSNDFNYEGVKDFDDTRWMIGGNEAEVYKTSNGEYYVDTDDSQEVFTSRKDLIKYLRDNGATSGDVEDTSKVAPPKKKEEPERSAYTGPNKKVIQGKTFKVDTSSGKPVVRASMYDTNQRLSKLEKFAKENGITIEYEESNKKSTSAASTDSPKSEKKDTPPRQRRSTSYGLSEYDGVKEFDDTIWSIGDDEAEVTKTRTGGYYLQTSDHDEEFNTKADLIRYLIDQGAEFQTQL